MDTDYALSPKIKMRPRWTQLPATLVRWVGTLSAVVLLAGIAFSESASASPDVGKRDGASTAAAPYYWAVVDYGGNLVRSNGVGAMWRLGTGAYWCSFVATVGVATDFAIMTVLLLFTCYKFRAYIGGAEVPSAIPHLIDFSLAISACAIALVSLPGSEVTLGGIPPVIIAACPALVVAAMIFIIHLRRSQSGTPRWSACLAVAVIGGLLAGPLKALLTSPLAAFADLLPVNWG